MVRVVSHSSRRGCLRAALLRAGANAFLAVALFFLATGCASTGLQKARANFYAGRLDMAETNLQETAKSPGVDRVLVLMEQGTVEQTLGRHADAVKTWVAASSLAKDLNYYSVGKGSASFVVNDRVQAFRGAPFERTLMRSLCAISYLMMSAWDDAAVEARNIVSMQERLEGFPDDAFSHYVAACAYQMIDDENNARIEYERAAKLTSIVKIDPKTGFLSAAATNGWKELVVFAGLGRTPPERGNAPENLRWGADPYVEILGDGRPLGRTYTLASTQRLMAETQVRLAALNATKTVSRVVLKEALAESIERQNRPLGELVRIILFAMETPDTRRWELLPLWLQVGRCQVPAGVKNLELSFHGRVALDRQPIGEQIARRRNTSVIFVRPLPSGR